MAATESSAFGILLRQHRVEVGLTQEELAERAQLSARVISDLERGVTHAPRQYTVRQLADALGLVDEERARFKESAHIHPISLSPPTEAAPRSNGTLWAAPGARPSTSAATETPRVAETQSFTRACRSAMVRHKRALAPTAVALLVVLALAVIVVPKLGGTRHATAHASAPPVMGRVDPHWPLVGPAPGALDKPEGMALDASGDLYVVDSGNNCIDKFSSAGGFLGSFGSAGSGPGQFRHPVGVAVDDLGNVYISDTGNDRIQKLSPRGKWLASWGHRGVLGRQFRSPQGIAVDSAGNVVVADWGNNRVQELSSEGSVLAVWGTGVAGPDLRHPRAVALDPQGNIYVADGGSADRLHEFTADGTLLGDWGTSGLGAGQIRNPTGIAVAPNGNILVIQDSGVPALEFEVSTYKLLAWQPRGVEIGAAEGVAIGRTGTIYVADARASQVLKLSAAGTLKNRWGSVQLSPAGFKAPAAVAVDPKGDLYVVDTGRRRVVELSSGGRPLAQLGPGKVGYPQALATDREGNLYVLDGVNFRVRRFSPSGRLLAQWGSLGMGASQFLQPQGIAVGSSGEVYVSDNGAGTIQKFSPNGKLIPGGLWKIEPPAVANGIGSLAVDRAGDVYVAYSSAGTILKLSPVGHTIATWGSIGIGRGQFIGTLKLTVDRHGDVYVADARRVQEFLPDESVVAVDGGSGSPAGIAVDSRYDVFVADGQTNRVYKLIPRKRRG